MENDRMTYLKTVVFLVLLTSCSVFKPDFKGVEFATCPVCKMKVNTSEGYQMTFNGTTYFFDIVECKNVFKMNPERFVPKTARKDKGVL
jgi:YHS domain-containing protein